MRNTQRGAALITALLIAAIATLLATALIVRQHRLIRQTQQLFTADQMALDLAGVRDWAIAEIQQSLQVQHNLHTTFGPKKFHQAVLTGQISDQQAFFNLNDLRDARNQVRFDTLLMTVVPNMTLKKAMQLSQALTRWINIAVSARQNFRLATVAELHSVPGFTTSIARALLPYVTVLPNHAPTQIPINVNTVSAPVLMTLSSHIDAQKAGRIVACVKSHGVFQSADEYNTLCLKPLAVPALTTVTTTSQFYRVQATANLHHQQRRMECLLQATNRSNAIQVRVIWQAME